MLANTFPINTCGGNACERTARRRKRRRESL
jgi:hypothetical protein